LAQEEARRRAEEQAKADAEAALARQAEAEARAKAAAEAEALRRAEQEARRKAEDEARAVADAERRRVAEADAARRAEEEAAALAAAEAASAAAAEAAREAEAAERQALEAAAAEAAAAVETARRAQEEARLAAEAEARAAAEAEAHAREEAEAARRAEDEAARRAQEEAKAKAEAEARAKEQEEARQRAEEETRARIAAESRAKEEEEARRRAAALLSRPKAPVAPVVDDAPDPAVAMVAPAATPPGEVQAVKPVAQQPVAQQPSTMKAPPRPDPKTRIEERVVKEGDLVCDQCGEGNDPARKFCRKCGNSLAKAVPAKKVPWWKKLFSPKVRASKSSGGAKAKLAKANDARFKSRLWLARVRYAFGFLAIVGIVGVNLRAPNLRTQAVDKAQSIFTSAKDMFNPQFEPVNAVEVTASSAAANHPPGLANDLGSNTYWAEGVEGDGIGQSVSFRFETKVDLTKVIISSGAAESPDVFLNQPRPKQLHLVFDNGGSADITLKDQLKNQGFTLKGAKGVSKVDIVISSVYKGKAGTDTAIAEVEFKKKG
jgi:hypothetical protein